MFDGENNIPKTVLDAMKLNDYDKGKPLTARRIIAVKQAIDDLKVSHIETAKKNAAKLYLQDKFSKEHVDQLIETAINACNNDKDTLNLVENISSYIVQNSNSNLRSTDKIKNIVQAYADNIEELRTASQGNPALFKEGVKLLEDSQGKPLAKGTFTSFATSLNTMKLNDVKKLSASVSPENFHKGVTQLLKNVKKALDDAPATHVKLGEEEPGADEMDRYSKFLTQMVFHKLGDAGVKKIEAAWHSDAAQQVVSHYYQRGGENCQAQDLHMETIAFFNLAESFLGHEISVITPLKGELDLDDDCMKTIDAYIDERVKSARDMETKAIVDATVKGESAGANIFRGILTKKLQSLDEPSVTWRAHCTQNTSALLGLSVANECKKMAQGQWQDTAFFNGRQSKITVNLPDNTKLSSDFETARDQIAQFVTKGAKASYKELDEKEQNKAHIMMTFLSSASVNATERGVEFALDPKMSQAAFSPLSNYGGNKSLEFTLSQTKNGTIHLSFSSSREISGFEAEIDGKNVSMETGPGSKIDSGIHITIGPDDLNSLAETDFKNFDTTKAMEYISGNGDNKLLEASETFPQPFQDALGMGGMGMSVSILYKPTIN